MVCQGDLSIFTKIHQLESLLKALFGGHVTFSEFLFEETAAVHLHFLEFAEVKIAICIGIVICKALLSPVFTPACPFSHLFHGFI